MSNGDHSRTDTPSREQGTGMERHAPTKQPPRESKLFSLPRIVTSIAIIVLIVLVGRWIWPSGSTAPSLQRTARTYDAHAPTSGYSGHATNTHLLSPNWASGIETAWRLPLNAEDKNATVFLYAEGSTLYVTFQSILGSSKALTAQAYDLSGAEPRLLWDEKKQKPPYIDTSAFIVTDTDIVFNSIIIHKATGRLSHTPWENAKPVAFADGIVVTCDGIWTCKGWARDSSGWMQQWSSWTATQAFDNLSSDRITHPTSRVITDNETTSVLLPIKTSEHPAQLIDPRSGVVTDLEDPASYDTNNPRGVLLARDGVIAYDDYTALTFDAGGFLVGVQPASTGGRMTTDDGTLPSIADIQEFFSGSAPTWATATVKTVNGAKGEQCPFLTVTPTDGSPSRAVCPGDNNLNHTYVAYSSSDIRVSPRADVVFAQFNTLQRNNEDVFVDTRNGSSYVSEELNAAKDLTWVFDDLLVGVIDNTIVAFTPHSS